MGIGGHCGRWAVGSLVNFVKLERFNVANKCILGRAPVPQLGVLWQTLSLILSSNKELDQHHNWNVIMWLDGSSLGFPSNLGMSEGSFMGIGGHYGRWVTGSFVNFVRSGRFNVAKNDIPGRAPVPQLGVLCWTLWQAPMVFSLGKLKLPGL